jgi:hypothetical protein
VLGVSNYFVLSDPTQKIELHRLLGSFHANDVLIIYLPPLDGKVVWASHEYLRSFAQTGTVHTRFWCI